MKTLCYIARYPLSADGNDLNELILAQDTHWTSALSAQWDSLVLARKPSEPMLQAWYSSPVQVECLATTNQPFKLS